MSEKLTYIKNSNNTIKIDLLNGFSIIIFENYIAYTNKFKISLYLQKDGIDILDLIEEQDDIEIDANKRNINIKLLKYVSSLLSNGFFNYYIERYNYMLRCFDKGNEIIENERLSGVC